MIECGNEIIELDDATFLGKQISRQSIGNIAVCIDILICLIFLLSVWIITYLVNLDAQRHKNLYFETSEFSIVINNLPYLHAEYKIEQMKSELWDHL